MKVSRLESSNSEMKIYKQIEDIKTMLCVFEVYDSFHTAKECIFSK